MKEIWMPHPGHLCVASSCKFVMNTYVNGYIVSTVGEWVPYDRQKNFPQFYGANWMKNFEEIGLDRFYETMVFKAKRNPDNGCCPYRAVSGENIDQDGYNSADDARKGHMKMLNKYRRKTK